MPGGKRIYFGWWVVLVCFLLMAVTFPPMYTLVGQTVVPMAEEFGVNRTTAGLVVIAGFVGIMIGSPFAGRLNHRYGPRRMVSAALIGTSACGVVIFFAPGIELVIALSVMRGLIFSLVGIVAVSIMVTAWFGKRLRGKAQALTMMGSGIGGIIISPILGKVIVELGWRYSYLMFAVLNIAILPLVLIFFSRPSKDAAHTRLGDEVADGPPPDADSLPGLRWKQVLHSRMFWFSFCLIVVMGGANQTWNINAAPFYEDLGIGRVQVGTLVAITSLSMMASKFILGMVCDKLGARFAAMISISSMFVGYGLAGIVSAMQAPYMAVFCAVLPAVWISMSTTVMPVMAAELYGPKEYGICVGYCQMGDALGGSLIPIFTTMLFDVTGSYTLTFSLCSAVAVLMMVILFVSYRLRQGDYEKLGLKPEAL